MAGFDVYSGTARLVFSGTRYDGLEVRMRTDLPLGQYMEWFGLATLEDRWNYLQERGVLIEWNAEKDGEPLPVGTPAADLPVALLKAIEAAWITAVTSVDNPLVSTSPGGNTSEAAQT